MDKKVDHLKRIMLLCQIAISNKNITDEDCEYISEDHYNNPEKMEFIYGIGPEGLAPIEFKLAKASVGETFHWNLVCQNLYSFFGHLPHPHWVLPSPDETICLKVSVEKIQPASPKEIVTALAEIVHRKERCCCC